MIVVFDLSCYLTKMKLNRNTAGGAESGKATPNSLFMKLYKTTECMGRGDALGPGPRRCPPPPLLFAGVRRRETPFPAMVGVLDKVPAGSEMTPFAFSLLFYFLPLFLWPLGIPHLQGEEDFLLTVHLGGHTGMLTHRKENCIFFFSSIQCAQSSRGKFIKRKRNRRRLFGYVRGWHVSTHLAQHLRCSDGQTKE